MTDIMPPRPDALPTRASLLHRLKDCEDQANWQEFYQIYRDLLWRFALKTGCTESEAEDVVQETVIAVARKPPEFKYDPAVCAFKTWLLKQTMWRVKDQFRKRGKAGQSFNQSRSGETPARPPDDTRRTATIEGIADPAGNEV